MRQVRRIGEQAALLQAMLIAVATSVGSCVDRKNATCAFCHASPYGNSSSAHVVNVAAIGITSQFVTVSVIAAGIATDSHHGVLPRCVTARLQVLEMRIWYITGSCPANTRNCAASSAGLRAGAAMRASLAIRA
ncbi:hypothetical protein [Burkholderia metallica]|uniref:hypothetical protein n=1 Tax=Burkholderia metallica TaxID=488729 RepID=UPI001CF379A5|nr:hypothetical protein [Burkholderia metallica]MCA8000175.1 hypothetical protein [Burkholderia metallica]